MCEMWLIVECHSPPHHTHSSGGLLSEARALLGRATGNARGGDDSDVSSSSLRGCYSELLQALLKERQRAAALEVWEEMRDKVRTCTWICISFLAGVGLVPM
jgi:pentatricopeptide repeat protein